MLKRFSKLAIFGKKSIIRIGLGTVVVAAGQAIYFRYNYECSEALQLPNGIILYLVKDFK